MNVRPFLTFRDPETERAFRTEHQFEAAQASRLVAMVGVVGVAVFGFLDVVETGWASPNIFVRYAFMVPLLLLVALSATTAVVRSRIDMVTALVFASLVAAEAVMLLWANADQVLVYQMGLLVIVVAGYGGTRLRWAWATGAGVVGSLVAAGLIVVVMDGGWQRQAVLLLLATTNVIGATVAWSHEQTERRLFLDSLRIRRQSRELGLLNNRLRDQALTDTLTGLGNRRALDARLARDLNRVQQDGSTFGLALLDLDGFKALNDHLGHAAGDELLREVGGVLRANLRDGDGAYRLGGDEFCVVLAERSAEQVGLVVDRIRRQVEVESLSFHEAVSFSAGCTTIRAADRSPAVALERADALLYLAKAHGKGQVETDQAGKESVTVSPAVRVAVRG